MPALIVVIFKLEASYKKRNNSMQIS
uniref:Uncharacterized protein n=1 Tax=Rhizophora mucronata TaxID=61149 RepID=A0A2P2N431_RHIMU